MSDTVTKDDLRQFRLLLVNEIKELLQGPAVSTEDTDPEWIRSKAIRRTLDISPATLQNLRITGKIRCRKVMGSYYYNRADVIKLFEGGS